MIDKEFLTAQLQGVENAEGIITAIIAEYDKEKLAILKNRDDMKVEKEKIEKKFADLTANFTELEAAKNELNEKLESGLPDKEKKIYQTEIETLKGRITKFTDESAKIKADHEAEIKKLSDEKTHYIIGEEFSKLIHENKAIKPTMRNGLIKRFFAENPLSEFSPFDYQGKTEYVNKADKKMSDILNDFFTTDEGKEYLLNLNNGGGAAGSSGTKTITSNPFVKGKENLTEQAALFKNNPAEFARLKEAAKAG